MHLVRILTLYAFGLVASKSEEFTQRICDELEATGLLRCLMPRRLNQANRLQCELAPASKFELLTNCLNDETNQVRPNLPSCTRYRSRRVDVLLVTVGVNIGDH